MYAFEKFAAWIIDSFPGILRNLISSSFKFIKKHWLVFACLFFAVCLCYGFLVFSIIKIKKSVVAHLEKTISCRIKVEKIDVTPGLRFQLQGVVLTDIESELKMPFMKLESIVIAADIPSLIKGDIKLTEITLSGPSITIYQEPDGKYNISNWLSGSIDCAPDSFLDNLPYRVNVKDAVVNIEPPAGASWYDTFRAGVFSGYLGRTQDNNIGIHFDLYSFGSSVEIKGGMVPCDREGFQLTAYSPEFDFSNLREKLGELLIDRNASESLPGGTGVMHVSMEGNVTEPYVSGSVSLRNFDATFSYNDLKLIVTEVRAGMGTERIKGSGSVDFSEGSYPFEMSFVLEDIDVQRVFRNIAGFSYAPDGLLSGYANMSGTLKNFSSSWDRGNFRITDGAIKFPSLDLRYKRKKRFGSVSIPFESLSARIATRDNRLNIIDIKMKSRYFDLKGAGSLSGFNGFELFDPGVSYSFDLDMKAFSAAELFSYFPSLKGRIGGELSSKLRLWGEINRAGYFGGNGTIKLKDGFYTNPYSGNGGLPLQIVYFDVSDYEIELGTESLHIKKSNMTGNGIDMQITGDITYDGMMNINGIARLSSEWASQFYGLLGYVSAGDIYSLTNYKSDFSVRGTIWEPVHKWEKPKVTRWR